MFAFNSNLLLLCRQRSLMSMMCWAAAGLMLGMQGCTKPQSSKEVNSVDDRPATPPKRIYAQGQIMPAQGIIKIYTAPGDVVVEIPKEIKAGAKVQKQDVLAIMRSNKALNSQQISLDEQKQAAIRERDNAVKQAELKLSAAQMKVQQVELQQQSLDRQASLISKAEQQISDSEKILQQLRNIAADSMTREFVGQLEIDRQRLTIEEARSKVLQQRLTHSQAVADLQFAVRAAKAEVDAAQEVLGMARQVDPAKAFDAQIAALQAEEGRSVLRSPIDGVVLALHTSVGGSVFQTPLIELANLDSMVCELEVNVSQARWIERGQEVTIQCDSLPEPLSGRVQEKSSLVGKPKLRSLDPLAAVDYRTLSVIVDLSEPKPASHWLQLQVEAQIELSNASHP